MLKLFDRSVDFAKFPEDASLYTLSRAWMKNKPHEPIHRFRDSETQDGSTDQDVRKSLQVHFLNNKKRYSFWFIHFQITGDH